MPRDGEVGWKAQREERDEGVRSRRPHRAASDSKDGVARHLHAGASDPSELSKSWRFWEIGRSKLQHSRIAVRQGRADVSDA